MHQNGQLVFQIELEILNFQPFNTLTPSLKIVEVMKFQKWLIAKQNLGKNCCLKLDCIALFGPLKQILSELNCF
jgi:hypothetical protein